MTGHDIKRLGVAIIVLESVLRFATLIVGDPAKAPTNPSAAVLPSAVGVAGLAVGVWILSRLRRLAADTPGALLLGLALTAAQVLLVITIFVLVSAALAFAIAVGWFPALRAAFVGAIPLLTVLVDIGFYSGQVLAVASPLLAAGGVMRARLTSPWVAGLLALSGVLYGIRTLLPAGAALGAILGSLTVLLTWSFYVLLGVALYMQGQAQRLVEQALQPDKAQ